MMKHWMKAFGFLAIAMFALLTACDEEGLNITDVENYTDEAVYRLEEQGRCGRGGCFEFVFPITINLPDGTTAEAADYQELRNTIRSWKEANPDAEDRPTLGFPLEVTTEDGEVISVEDSDQLRELRSECRRDFGPRRPGHHGRHCFKLVFPISLEFPDGTTAEAADQRGLKELARDWKANNPDATERPVLAFPLDVEMQDGTTVTVNSIDELKDLKDTCRQG